MNKKLVVLTLSFSSFSLIQALWSTSPIQSFASQKADYKAKKAERTVAAALFNKSEAEEQSPLFERCYDNCESTEQCRIVRRLIQITVSKLSAKVPYTEADFNQAFNQTPNNKRELCLIARGQLKDTEEEISDKETADCLTLLHEAIHGKKLTEEEKNLLAQNFKEKLLDGNIAAKFKFSKKTKVQ